MSSPPTERLESVIVEDVSKTFRLPQERVQTLKERVLHPMRRRRIDDFHVLEQVTFDVRQGEFFGIVGRNGSGKSTLLKCIAGIYATDSGRIRLRGRVATFIELGVGFNPDLSARDNVVINAIMLGLSPAEARERYDSVIDFAELHEFEDLKLKNYSSGMFVRLAFATMIQVDADILLIDEVLAVGDVSFQHKCHEVLEQMRRRGRTILFVTHDMPTVEQKCDRALLLERGELVEVGEPGEISRRYDEVNFNRGTDVGGRAESARRGDGAAELLDAWFEDEHGLRTVTVERGRPCTLHVVAELRQPADDPVVGVTLGNQHVPQLVRLTSRSSVPQTGHYEAGERIELTVELTLPMEPGRYSVSPYVSHGTEPFPAMDARDDHSSITITGSRRGMGLVEVPYRLEAGRPARVEARE